MANSFDRVDAGEHVFINRGSKKMYAIIAVSDDDLAITPALAAKMEQARREYREGKALKFESASAAQKWMDEL